jgi:hypothetical protein
VKTTKPRRRVLLGAVVYEPFLLSRWFRGGEHIDDALLWLEERRLD